MSADLNLHRPRSVSVMRRAALSTALALSALPVGLIALARSEGAPTNDVAVSRAVVPLVAWAAVLLVAGLGVKRVRSSLLGWSLLASTAIAILACAIYVVYVSSLVRYPADILSWTESPFVQDIIHFRTGQPLYGDPSAASSFFYPPMTQLTTYGIATVLGAPTSIPVYRGVQLFWLVIASGVGVLIVDEMLRLANVPRDNAWTKYPVLSRTFAAAFLFLVATNSITSPFAHNLHHDSLATLISAVAILGLLRYARTRDARWLVVLSVLPAVGFLVKQSLAIWAPLSALAVLIIGGPRGLKRAVIVGVVSVALVGAVNVLGMVLWGDAWSFWVIAVLRAHAVSPLRSVQHVTQAWIIFVMLIAGGMVLVRAPQQRSLGAVWLVCCGLLVIEAYTSGIAWMLNHMAPGSFLAGAWGLAGLLSIWSNVVRETDPAPGEQLWRGLRATGITALAALLLCGVGAARIPVAGLPPDADRYRKDIENAVSDALRGSDRVLLDHGSWPFVARGLSVGDRSAAIGEFGVTGMSDFAATLGRIRQRYYSRILVRDYQTTDFFYDLPIWARSSGIAKALDENYRVVGVIPRVQGGEGNPFFATMSILAPRDEAAPAPEVR